MQNPLITFVGDDFTGSTDALEVLTLAGVRTMLFTRPPSPAELSRWSGLQAFGLATTARSQPPAAMRATLEPIFRSLKNLSPPIVHYKVCSTFDSSPQLGSIGCAIETGRDVFGPAVVPIVAAAPALGRHCVFGNLFALHGSDGATYRIDRHPSMSRHPVTPMLEADLLRHLAAQTTLPIELLDILEVSGDAGRADDAFDALAAGGAAAVLIDLVAQSQQPAVGRLIQRLARADRTLFVAGSSGVESSLCDYWNAGGLIHAPALIEPPPAHGPILVLCGSCSPVTAGQIQHAAANGFASLSLPTHRLVHESPQVIDEIATAARGHLLHARCVVVHSAGTADSRTPDDALSAQIGDALGAIGRRVLTESPVRRVLIAGGDTSGQIAAALCIEAMEMIAPLARGAPMVRVHATPSPVDGVEMVFKGGQIGPIDFFSRVAR